MNGNDVFFLSSLHSFVSRAMEIERKQKQIISQQSRQISKSMKNSMQVENRYGLKRAHVGCVERENICIEKLKRKLENVWATREWGALPPPPPLPIWLVGLKREQLKWNII